MAAPVVVNSGIFSWSAAYPLNASGTIDATGADLLVVFVYAATGNLSWTPSCTFAGTAGVLIEQSSAPDINGGTLWTFYIKGFTPGSGTLSLSRSEYVNDGACYVVALSGGQAVPIGNHNVVDVMTPTCTASTTASAAGSLILSFSGAVQAPVSSSTATPSGTLVTSYTAASSTKGYVYKAAGPSAGSAISMATVAPYNYSAAAVIEVLGSSGGGSGGEPVSLTMITNLSLSVGLGGGSISFPAPRIDMAGHLSLTTALGTVSMAAPHIDLGANLSIAIAMPAVVMAAPHIDVAPLAVTLTQLSGEMAAPHLDVGPLALVLDLPPAELTVPNLVTAGPLAVSLGLGAVAVRVPPVISATSLDISILAGTGTVKAPLAVIMGPLVVSLVQGQGEILTYTPPIGADPLFLALDVGSGEILNPWAISADPLSVDLEVGAGHIYLPVQLVAPPLMLSWERIPKPYAGTRPLKLRVMMGRQLTGNPTIVVG